MKKIRIGGKIIGDDAPCFVIAEMAWSHDGSLEKAIKIVDGAADAKADAICMHFTSVKDYMTEDYGIKKGVSVDIGKETVYQYLERANLKYDEWKALVLRAKQRNLSVCVMCNDAASVDFAASLGADAFVIPPAAMVEEDFIRKIGRQAKPLLIRAGGSTINEVKKDIEWLREEGNANIALIHGFQNFPTPPEEMHLRFLITLKQMFGLPVGFADHVDAESELAPIVPLVALGAGANIIEKHITHDRGLRGEDFESALNPGEFKKFVEMLREVEKSLGLAEVRELSEKEKSYRMIVRKRAVAAGDIAPGTIITRDMVLFKRASEGVYPDELGKIVGKKAKYAIVKDEGLTTDKFE